MGHTTNQSVFEKEIIAWIKHFNVQTKVQFGVNFPGRWSHLRQKVMAVREGQRVTSPPCTYKQRDLFSWAAVMNHNQTNLKVMHGQRQFGLDMYVCTWNKKSEKDPTAEHLWAKESVSLVVLLLHFVSSAVANCKSCPSFFAVATSRAS